MRSTPQQSLGRELEALIQAGADRLRASRRTTALTGAGLSVESGIPPFRRGAAGGAGLWERYDPIEYGTIEAFRRDPERVWMMLRDLSETLSRARPNPGHHALARMEGFGLVGRVITQNVDGLHQEAGSAGVLELHGNWRTMTCVACRRQVRSEGISLERLPPRCDCGGALKPDVILFGEIIPAQVIDAAFEEARGCDCLIVVGTSLDVDPAASIPQAAHDEGAFIIEVNVEETPISSRIADLCLRGPAGLILPALAERAGAKWAC